MLNGIQSVAMTGINNGLQQLKLSVGEIASSQHYQDVSPSPELGESLMRLKQAELQTIASIRVMQSADQILDDLLNRL